MLRFLRTERELGMDEVAAVAGISSSFVNRLELGHSRYASIKVFRGLRVALGVTGDDRRILMANPFGAADEADTDEVAA